MKTIKRLNNDNGGRSLLEELKKNYFEWLYRELFGDNPDVDPRYWSLCLHLFRIQYHWFVPNDDNRAGDGKSLRIDFGRWKFGEYESWWDAPCNVLEMLVGLSIRIEFQMSEKEWPIGEWFILFLKNLNIAQFTDEVWSAKTARIVDENITRFMTRKYNQYGHGGVFPLKEGVPVRDQRKTEIWSQMMDYMRQYFPLS